MSCLEASDLERYREGTLSDEERSEVERHLAECDRCRRQSREFEENLRVIARARQVIVRGAGAEDAPNEIGPFRIQRELGRGGMGVVYLAEQTSPRRTVALKVLRSGRTSAALLRRFEREADALARLNHPSIARVLETGVAETREPTGWRESRPWLAMEYVDGPTLDEWVAEAKPALRSRVELLVRLADAVHHAHLHGVVHRDLKPSNVLVERGTDDRPKVLDFGVARILEAGAGASLHTEVGNVLGTLPFMSPEQVLGDPTGIDARSDIYSLGVIAFWLLSGTLPYDVSHRSLPDAARVIRDEEPGPLSRVVKNVPSDVATIVAKALEKDPARRYASADAFASDLRRFLADEPISARRPSAWYSLRKFVTRHRIVVVAAVAVFTAAIAAAVVSTSAAVRARRAEADARASLLQADAVNEFLLGMLSSANPEVEGSRRATTVREVLDNAARDLADGKLSEHPETEAAVRRVLGNAYGVMGAHADGERELRHALALQERRGDGADTFEYVRDLGLLIKEVRNYAEAESLFRRSLELARAGNDLERVENALTNLSGALGDLNRLAEAESVLVEAIDVHRARAPDSSGHYTHWNNLGVLRFRRGDVAEACDALETAVELSREALGDDHPSTLTSLGNLAFMTERLGDTGRAEALYRDWLDGLRRVHGEDHHQVSHAEHLLGALLSRLPGREDEGEQLMRQAIERVRSGPPDAATTVPLLQSLARHFVRQERHAEADSTFGEALAIAEATWGFDHERAREIRSQRDALPPR